GDTNGDGVVNIDDLNNVRDNFGGAGLGDTNADGLVNIDDLNNVRNNFGAQAIANVLVSAAPPKLLRTLVRSSAATKTPKATTARMTRGEGEKDEG
ncbi:MAG: hypothetical protein ACE5EY_15090, partial [Anaerolineae bacterium]